MGIRRVMAVLFTAAAFFVYANAEAEPQTVVVIGASFSAGYRIGLEASYPTQLEKMLRSAGLDVNVVNMATTGYTTGHMKGMMGKAIDARPDLVIFQPGTNDMAKGGGTIDCGNVEDIIRTTLDAGAKLFLMGGNTCYPVLKTKALRIRRWYFAPFAEPGDLQVDQEHPTVQGSQHIAQLIFPMIKVMLKNSRKVNSDLTPEPPNE